MRVKRGNYDANKVPSFLGLARCFLFWHLFQISAAHPTRLLEHAPLKAVSNLANCGSDPKIKMRPFAKNTVVDGSWIGH